MVFYIYIYIYIEIRLRRCGAPAARRKKSLLSRRVGGRAKTRADVKMVDPSPLIGEGIDKLVGGTSDVR